VNLHAFANAPHIFHWQGFGNLSRRTRFAASRRSVVPLAFAAWLASLAQVLVLLDADAHGDASLLLDLFCVIGPEAL
jgi:hypothetical protein